MTATTAQEARRADEAATGDWRSATTRMDGSSYASRVRSIFAAFWLSGFAAILYQLIWQRVLLGSFGVNIEAVSVVVAAFMLGLGAGGLVGARLSASPRRLERLFVGTELGVAAFGLTSVPLFRAIGVVTAGWPGDLGLFAALGALLVPTILMGATLPLLVALIIRELRDVRRTVGALYFVNTLGSAFGAFAAIAFVLGRFGQLRSALLAASINVVAALTVLRGWRVRPHSNR